MSWSAEPATELQEHFKQITEPYKYPREIEFVDVLPKPFSGYLTPNSQEQKVLRTTWINLLIKNSPLFVKIEVINANISNGTTLK